MLKKIRLDKLYQFLILLFLLANTTLVAQEQKLTFKIKSNPTDSDYWWLEKNNFGIKPANFDFRGGWELKTSKTTYVINILVQDDSEKIYFKESYIKYNFSDKTFIRMGRYYRDFSKYLNDNISSGHMLISHNARPMPKIGLVTSKNIEKFNKLTFEGGIAHGFFEKENYYTKAPLLHEKFIYMHIKNNNYRISWGLVHEAMWGGGYPEQTFSHSFKDFLKILTAEDGFDAGGTNQNALGNHIAIWDFIFEKTNNEKLTKLYYQHIFEETSGLRFRNGFDGLWGIELINYIPKTNLLIEHLVTSNQFRNPNHFEKLYYYHYHYKLGWSYNNYILGNPYIKLPDPEDYPNWPIESQVDVIHFGINGEFLSNYYEIKFGRKTSIGDNFQYKISIGKEINSNFNIGLFIANNDNKTGGGLIFSKNF